MVFSLCVSSRRSSFCCVVRRHRLSKKAYRPVIAINALVLRRPLADFLAHNPKARSMCSSTTAARKSTFCPASRGPVVECLPERLSRRMNNANTSSYEEATFNAVARSRVVRRHRKDTCINLQRCCAQVDGIRDDHTDSTTKAKPTSHRQRVFFISLVLKHGNEWF